MYAYSFFICIEFHVACMHITFCQSCLRHRKRKTLSRPTLDTPDSGLLETEEMVALDCALLSPLTKG